MREQAGVGGQRQEHPSKASPAGYDEKLSPGLSFQID